MARALRTLFFIGVYLSLGALTHILVVGPTLDPYSAWTFGALFGWPFVLLAYAMLWAFYLILGIGAVTLLVVGYNKANDFIERKRAERAASTPV